MRLKMQTRELHSKSLSMVAPQQREAGKSIKLRGGKGSPSTLGFFLLWCPVTCLKILAEENDETQAFLQLSHTERYVIGYSLYFPALKKRFQCLKRLHSQLVTSSCTTALVRVNALRKRTVQVHEKLNPQIFPRWYGQKGCLCANALYLTQKSDINTISFTIRKAIRQGVASW